jgi:pimeloyl-ACP methyl ester carboxylesterase
MTLPMQISGRLGPLLLLALVTACGRGGDIEPAPAPPPKPRSSDGALQRVASADGVSLGYRVYGSGDPALLFIHGWAADHTYWDAQIDAFKARYTVVTLDLAGHGESGLERRRWTMDAYAEDIIAIARGIPARHLVLIGHSMGGAVALQAARQLDERVIGVIGADTFQNIANPPVPPEMLERRLEPFRRDFPTAMRDYAQRSFFTPRSNPVLVSRIAESMANASPAVALGSIHGVNDMNFSAALADIAVPIVAINSDLVPTDEQRIRIHAPTFRLKVIPGVGHFVMVEDPARFNAVLEQTLQELQ